MNMLNIYTLGECPHCRKTIAFLVENRIEFVNFDMDEQPDHVVQKIIEVNGGEDWVVPTLEFDGRWRKGKIFDAQELTKDLQDLGVIRE